MTERIRGRALQAIRARWLRLHPLCVRCMEQGRTTLGTEVDHVIPLFKQGRDDDSNRQTLCTPCHLDKTAEDAGHKPGKGCDVNGWPISSRHAWNAKGRG